MGDATNNRDCLLVVRQQLIDHLGPQYNLPEPIYLAMFEEWHHRYHHFRWVISYRAVTYYKNLNLVKCKPHLWRSLKEINLDVLYYTLRGKHMWDA